MQQEVHCTTYEVFLQTEAESDQASRANYQFPRNTGIEDYVKLCLSGM